MRSGSRTNALLVELMIVVLFFMIASTVLLRIFAASHQQSTRAEILTQSLAEAQNTADRLYAAEDPEAELNALGFVRQDDLWILEFEGYRIEAQTTEESEPSGIFRRQSVQVVTNGEVLFSLPCSRWQEVSR